MTTNPLNAMKLLHSKTVLALATTILFLGAKYLQADELPRRISLGVQAQPVSDESRKKLGLRTKRGVEVMAVVPNSTAEAAGIKAGDVLLAFGGKTFAGVPQFIERIGTLRSDQELELLLNREGKEVSLKAKTKALAFESSPDFEIEYGYVSIPNGRLRTVLTIPKEGAGLGAIVLLSGLGNATVEHPATDPTGLRSIAHALTKRGYAVLRVDKPGCGDSEGGPSADADFQSVIAGYVAGVRQIKKNPRINPNRITLFGCSMGGVQAPLVAAEEPVFAIGIFGAMSCNWQDFIRSTTRRQMEVAGADANQVNEVTEEQVQGWKRLMDEDLSPDDVAEKYPELTSWVEQNWPDGKSLSGVSYRFFQQLGKVDVLSAWKKFDGPVLSIWGDKDIVTLEEDHQMVAEVSNSRKPGNGKFLKLANIEHNLREVTENGPPSAQISEMVIDAIAQWVESIENRQTAPK